MIINPKYKNKTIGVLGLGQTGISLIKSFLSSGAYVIGYDDRKNSIDFNHPRLSLSSIKLDQIDYLALSPGIDPAKHQLIQEAIQSNLPIISDIDLLYDTCPSASYLVVTGTNGKSTTTNLINHILTNLNNKLSNISLLDKQTIHTSNKIIQMGGNIGIPVLSLKPIDDISAVYLLEMSSYQIDLLQTLKSQIAICLNITPDHLDRYHTMEAYAASKARIFNSCNYAIISCDYYHCSQIYETLLYKKRNPDNSSTFKTVIPFSVKDILPYGVSLVEGTLTIILPELEFNDQLGSEKRKLEINIREYIPLSLLGQHNAENILASITACLLYGYSLIDILNQLKSYKSLPHRMEIITPKPKFQTSDLATITWINDSKATNTASTQYALKAFSAIHWIVGGVEKEDSILALKNSLEKVICAYLIGASTARFAAQCKEINLPHELCYTLEEAMDMIRHKLQTSAIELGSTILLSPACASFDQWENFEKRGEYFIKRVQDILD